MWFANGKFGLRITFPTLFAREPNWVSPPGPLVIVQSAPASAEASHSAPITQEVKAAGVLLWVDNDHVIVGYNPAKKAWMDFGGKRQDESPEQCARRELAEETRLDPAKLEIDWASPEYVEICKYVFYQGRLGSERPEKTQAFSEYRAIDYTQPALAGNNFRLERVLAKARTSKHRPIFEGQPKKQRVA